MKQRIGKTAHNLQSKLGNTTTSIANREELHKHND
jgi:hypothetical protein